MKKKIRLDGFVLISEKICSKFSRGIQKLYIIMKRKKWVDGHKTPLIVAIVNLKVGRQGLQFTRG